MLSPKIDVQYCNVTIIKLQIDFVNIYIIRANTRELAQRMENEAITHNICLLNTLLRNLQIRKLGMAIILIGPNLVNPIVVVQIYSCLLNLHIPVVNIFGALYISIVVGFVLDCSLFSSRLWLVC